MTKTNRFGRLTAAIIISLFLLLAAFALTFTGGISKSASAAEETTAPPTAAVEYILGATADGHDVATADKPETFKYKTPAAGWTAAYAKAKELQVSGARNRVVKVTLASDWTAGSDGSFGTGTGFIGGMILLNEKVHIVLDLAGHIINRNLTVAKNDGYVIYDNATLEIMDSDPNGQGAITGGYNANGRGCIRVAKNYKLVLWKGKITGNKVKNTLSSVAIKGGAIDVESGAIFEMKGGEISNNILENTVAYGGGVYSAGSFKMTGGKITGNRCVGKDAYGGGIAVFGGTVDFSGGEISNNIAASETEDSTHVYGGGMFIYNTNTTIADGDGNNITKLNVKISGTAAIKDNKAELRAYSTGTNRDVYGGGIYLYNDSAGLEMTGGIISGNQTLKKESGSSDNMVAGGAGGGICNTEGRVDISGGLITDNYSEQSGAIDNSGILNIYGGKISGNRASWAGAVFFIAKSSKSEENALINIKGNPQIYDNICYKTTYAYGGSATDKNGVACYKSNILITSGLMSQNTSKPADYYEIYSGKFKPNYRINFVGALTEGANINFVTGSKGDGTSGGKPEGEEFALDYEKYNKTTKTVGGLTYTVPVDPSNYLHSDRGRDIVVTAEGHLVETRHNVSFGAKYAPETDDTAATASSVAYECAYESGNVLTAQLTATKNETFTTCNSVTVTNVSITDADGAAIAADTKITNAGVYYYKATIVVNDQSGSSAVNRTINVKYPMIIKPKQLTAENTVATITGTYNYDGNAKTPTYTLKHGEIDLVKGENADYTDGFAKNTNAGQGEIIVTYRGNYYGEVTYNFTINKAVEKYSVSWEYFDKASAGWKNVSTLGSAPLFKYNTEDRSGDLRAKLSVTGKADELIYKQGHAENRTNMYLTFTGTFDGNAVTSLLNSANYAVRIVGDSNYEFNADTDRGTTVAIAKGDLDLTVASFAECNVADATDIGRYLWLENLGEDVQPVRLTSNATYFDPSASVNPDYSAKVVTGNAINAYVRYNGRAHTVELNMNYTLPNGKKISDYTSSVEIGYSNQTSTGTVNTVNTVTTTVTITPNANWQGSVITFQKVWYIVTVNNRLVTEIGGEEVTGIAPRQYGMVFAEGLFRPEHGNTAIYILSQGTTALARFAVEFDGMTYWLYDVKHNGTEYEADKTKEITNRNYYNNIMQQLEVGTYTLNVRLPKSTVDGVVYYPVSCTYDVQVEQFEIYDNAQSSGLDVEILQTNVEYTGKKNNVPQLKVMYNGDELQKGVDYTLASDNVNVGGLATFVLSGKGNFTGSVTFEDSYSIVKATNYWNELPHVMQWTYGDYKRDVNLISAVPALLDDNAHLTFGIARDELGAQMIIGLDNIKLDANGLVSEAVAGKISKDLDVGTYYLFTTVGECDNYKMLAAPKGLPFTVFKGVNFWEVTPNVAAWEVGSYDGKKNAPVAVAKFGTVTVIVKNNQTGKIVYNSATGADDLKNAEVGKYTLTAYVEEGANFAGLPVYTFNFEVFEKPGLPWWGTLLIAVGALLIAALVLFILWKKGVFQILTGKITLAIRTRASIDATIASVRAAKMMEAGRQSVAEAKRKERLAELEKQAKEAKDKAAEQTASATDTETTAE